MYLLSMIFFYYDNIAMIRNKIIEYVLFYECIIEKIDIEDDFSFLLQII